MNTDPSSLISRTLSGQFLIAMPGMGDPRFDKSLIFLCDHNDEGAMGLIVNKPIIETDFAEICDFLDIDCPTRKGCSRFVWWPRGYPKRVGFAFT